MIVDPGEGGNRGGALVKSLPEGMYLLALVFFIRRSSSDGESSFLSGKYEIIQGRDRRYDGSVFWSTMGLSSAGRLKVAAVAASYRKPFDTESNHDMWEAFVGRAFKADLSNRERNGYENVEIGKYFLDPLTPDESDACREWEQQYTKSASRMKDPDEEGGSSSAPPHGYDAPSPADELGNDDIPF